jgi:hypothetical protein
MGLTTEELESAYGRAGRSFNGQLQQIFVVLNERDSDSLQSVAFKTGPAGGGRGGGGGCGKGRGWPDKSWNEETRSNTQKLDQQKMIPLIGYGTFLKSLITYAFKITKFKIPSIFVQLLL